MTHCSEGLLVPPGDPMALADAILQLLANPSVRQRMGDCGRATAQTYDWTGSRAVSTTTTSSWLPATERRRPQSASRAQPALARGPRVQLVDPRED